MDTADWWLVAAGLVGFLVLPWPIASRRIRKHVSQNHPSRRVLYVEQGAAWLSSDGLLVVVMEPKDLSKPRELQVITTAGKVLGRVDMPTLADTPSVAARHLHASTLADLTDRQRTSMRAIGEFLTYLTQNKELTS